MDAQYGYKASLSGARGEKTEFLVNLDKVGVT